MANPTQDDLGGNNPFNVGSFFFANAAKNSPLSYEALQTRRKIAESLLGRRSQLPFPKTLGEGLTYASKELADAYENRQTLADLEQRDREFQQGASQLPIPGAGPVPPTAAPPGAAADNGSGDGGGSPVVAAADTSLSPYAPSAAGPDETPLPPPRPVIDRSQQLGDMNDDPSLLPRLAATTMGELNPGALLPEQRTQFASALDRAGARGIPLSQALETYTGRGSRGYYPPDVVPRGAAQLRTPEQQQAFMRNVATPVLRGADPGGAALGFTPTGNASGGVADRGIASGRYGNAGSFPGRNETYVTQERGRPLPFSAGGPDTPPGANPDATRNAIASAMMAAPPVPFAGGTGAPGGGPDATAPAGPGNTQVASLGDTSGLLGNLRPQGAARQMDREAPLMPVPQGVPGNPAIQSDISPAPPPQQVAQLMGQGGAGGAQGGGPPGSVAPIGAVPGPLARPVPTPSPPPGPGTPLPAPLSRSQLPPPILNTQPTEAEIKGMMMLRTHPNPADPVNQNAKAWIAYGQQQRQSAFAQQQEKYKADLAIEAAREKAALEQNSPASLFDLQQKREAAAITQGERERFGGFTREEALGPIKDSYKTVQNLPAAAMGIQLAKQALLQDPKMFTGPDAQIQLSTARVMNMLGAPLDPRVPATEAFKAHLASILGAMRPSVVGPGSQSEKELATLQQAVGSDFTMTRPAIERILTSIEKLNTMAAIEHQKKVLTFTGGDDKNAQRAGFGLFGVPAMERVVPQRAVDQLKELYAKDPRGTVENFDNAYYTPGLAEAVLQSGR
jgi:hypothetical protein